MFIRTRVEENYHVEENWNTSKKWSTQKILQYQLILGTLTFTVSYVLSTPSHEFNYAFHFLNCYMVILRFVLLIECYCCVAFVEHVSLRHLHRHSIVLSSDLLQHKDIPTLDNVYLKTKFQIPFQNGMELNPV